MNGREIRQAVEAMQDLSWAARALYLYLATHGSPCWPSVSSLARAFGTAERYIYRLLDELRQRGAIERDDSGKIVLKTPLTYRSGPIGQDLSVMNHKSGPIGHDHGVMTNESGTPDLLVTPPLTNRSGKKPIEKPEKDHSIQIFPSEKSVSQATPDDSLRESTADPTVDAIDRRLAKENVVPDTKHPAVKIYRHFFHCYPPPAQRRLIARLIEDHGLSLWRQLLEELAARTEGKPPRDPSEPLREWLAWEIHQSHFEHPNDRDEVARRIRLGHYLLDLLEGMSLHDFLARMASRGMSEPVRRMLRRLDADRRARLRLGKPANPYAEAEDETTT